MSYIKVVEGKITKDSEIINLNKDTKEKLSSIYTMKNGELEEVESANAGDIVDCNKINSLKTGNTIASSSDAELFRRNCSTKTTNLFRSGAKNKGEEDKIGSSLNKIVEEDPIIHGIETQKLSKPL